jgi:hypothetical protein
MIPSPDDQRIANDRIQAFADSGYGASADDVFECRILLVGAVVMLTFTLGLNDYAIPNTRWGELSPALAAKVRAAARGCRCVKMGHGEFTEVAKVARQVIDEIEDREGERWDGQS